MDYIEMEKENLQYEVDTTEEVFFVEDRKPQNISSLHINTMEDKPATEVVTQGSENFIVLSSVDDEDLEKDIEMDGNDSVKIDKSIIEQSTDDLLSVVEDRNPLLTGQEMKSPRYIVNKTFLKMHNETPSKKRNKLANSCWNCGSTDHSLRECPEPRNHTRISKNRREFQDSKPQMPEYKRYHVEGGQYSHIIPGKPSDDLRKALGLGPRELPPYIYRMRLLGYPPGWLQDAVVSHSGIIMFDAQGKEVAAPGTEAGEVVEQGSLDKYDVRKIVQFPGFNVLPPADTYDDSNYWGCPMMSKRQSLEAMLEKLSGRLVGGYKRRKLQHLATESDFDESSQSIESNDMDYEETPEVAELPEDNCKFVPPLPDTNLPPPPPTELPESDTDSLSMLSTSNDETSLIELEEQKKLLLAALNDVTPLCSTPDNRIGKVKSVDFGTPILKSVSPYTKLPSAEKFSVNICDVINFENLPDSTGTYEKMNGIIHKVRSKLCKINKDD